MSSEEIHIGDLVTWSHPAASQLEECGVVIQFEDCSDRMGEDALRLLGPCRVWVLWNGKTKMAWTLPEMLKRIDKPVQN